MNLLLDTHTFLWWALDPQNLPKKALEALSDSGNRVVFSTVSSWEVQIKVGLGKLELFQPLQVILEKEITTNLWEILPVHLSHTWKLSEIPPLHRDPFDRMLMAQALVDDLVLVTKDSWIQRYPDIQTLWD